MHVVVFAGSKGGCGKSSLAIGVAVAASQLGERVYVIDTDPQQSIVSWASRREAELPHVDHATPAGLVAALEGLQRAAYSLAIIDTQGADTAGTAAAMRVSDLVVVPCRPFAIDVLAITATRDAVTRLNKPFCVVLNAVQPRVSTRLADAAEVFGGLVAPSIVNRFVHADAIAAGMGVTEYAPESSAADEVRELWAFIKGRLDHEQVTATN